jgi:hypothetical protein
LSAPFARRDGDGVPYYTFEFVIEKAGPSGFKRHNVSVLTAHDGVLLSLNAQCPEARWAEEGPKVRVAAESFRLLPASGGRGGAARRRAEGA